MSGHDAAAAGAVAPLLDPLLDALEAPVPSPTGGTAAAAAAAMGAALLVMVAHAGGEAAAGAAAQARALRQRLVELGDTDVTAYAAVLEAGRTRAPGSRTSAPEGPHGLADALLAAAAPPTAIAEGAAEVCELARRVHDCARPALRGDAALAGLLAEAAVAGATRLAEINLASLAREPGHDGERAARVAALRERCRSARERARRALAKTALHPPEPG